MQKDDGSVEQRLCSPRVAPIGTADFTVVEASTTRFGNLAKRTQLSSTKSAEAFHVAPRPTEPECVFTKRTNLAFFNEINDACPPWELCANPAEQTQFFLDRIEDARARVHPQVGITPFWRNGRNELIWLFPTKSRHSLP
jgi:hypothetical protein